MREIKDVKYKLEQIEILKKVFVEIGINNDNLIISREYLETEDFKKIMNLNYENIQKYYKTTRWNSVKTGLEKELNILKNMCRHNKIIIDKIQRKKIIEDKRVNYVLYKFDIPIDKKEILINL